MFEVILAGYGGQGIMLMGHLLAYAGMFEGGNVTWIPSYGPEMRGGTSNCTVIISDEPIGSPLVSDPLAVVAMNLPSLDKFECIVRTGGILIYNSSLIKREPIRSDIRILAVPCTEIADNIGNPRVANMVALGALLEATAVVNQKSVEYALKKALPLHRQDMLPINLEAIEQGRRMVYGIKMN